MDYRFKKLVRKKIIDLIKEEYGAHMNFHNDESAWIGKLRIDWKWSEEFKKNNPDANWCFKWETSWYGGLYSMDMTDYFRNEKLKNILK